MHSQWGMDAGQVPCLQGIPSTRRDYVWRASHMQWSLCLRGGAVRVSSQMPEARKAKRAQHRLFPGDLSSTYLERPDRPWHRNSEWVAAYVR